MEEGVVRIVDAVFKIVAEVKLVAGVKLLAEVMGGEQQLPMPISQFGMK